MTRKRKREVAGYESTFKETFAAEQTAPPTEALAAEVAGTDRLAAGCGSPEGPRPILDLGERLTIAMAGEIKERLAAFLQVPAAFLVVDGSRVAAVDTAGLQLLTVFCHEMYERGTEVLWRDASAILRQGAATLGLVERLRLHEL